VKEMRADEEIKREKERLDIERKEQVYDFIDKWKVILWIVPLILLIVILVMVAMSLIGYYSRIERGYVNTCAVKVEMVGDYYDAQMRAVNKEVVNAICDYYDEKRVYVEKVSDEEIYVEVDIDEWNLKYTFVQLNNYWRIEKYERIAYSDEKPGEIQGNFRSAKRAFSRDGFFKGASVGGKG
jgi:hypothetical protein